MFTRRWKAITVDYAAILEMDATEILGVCLTQRQAAILKALLTTAYWPTRWENLSITSEELKRMIAEIDWRLDGGCDPMKLRQNEYDPCLLEQSTDGGETWELAFDYKKCANTDMITIITNNFEWNAYNVEQWTIYDNDITNININWEYDGTPTDADRDAALCAAITQWVASLCSFAVNAIESENAQNEDALNLASGVTAAMGLAATTLAAFGVFPVALAVGGASLFLSSILIANIADWIAEDTEPYLDEDAQAEVVCAMYLAMMGETPTFANWESSLDDEMTGNAETIRLMVAEANSSEGAFMQWMSLYADLITIGVETVENDCDTCDTWEYTWRFNEASGSDPDTTYGCDEPEWYVVKAGECDQPNGGWLSEEYEDVGHSNDVVHIRIDMPVRTLLSVHVEASYLEGSVLPGDMNKASFSLYLTHDTYDLVRTEPFATQVDGIEDWEWNGTETGVYQITVMWRCSYSEADPPVYGDGHVYIRRIVVTGRGSNPFA